MAPGKAVRKEYLCGTRDENEKKKAKIPPRCTEARQDIDTPAQLVGQG